MSGGRPGLGDDTLVRRAGRGVAIQSAGLVALAMLMLVAIVTVVVVSGQSSSVDALLRSTVSSADDVGDPPPGTWLVIARGSRVVSSAGLPGALAAPLAQLRAADAVATGPVMTDLSMGERDFRVATRRRADGTVQAVVDLAPERAQQTALLRAMAVASLAGLVFALVLGLLLGRRAVRPLAQALRLQRMFIADASHELRTPLTLLSTRAQLLDRSLQGQGLQAQVLEDSHGVVHDVQRLGEVVDDLLVSADPGADENHEPVDVRGVVEMVVRSARDHAAGTGVALTYAPAEGAAPHVVFGSEPALRRAVLALVDNTVDHTPAGGQVQVRTRLQRDDVIVSVSDTGVGIAPGAASHPFRRFHSGGQRSGRAHYGLGLALTHDVANRHGGQLRIATAAVGTTFELVLPAARAARDVPSP